MGPRNINDILAEVSSKSDPQRQIVMRQIADLTPQQQAAEQGLDAKRDRGFEDITLGARRRGVAYWGAPIAEQQKYLATDYLPAVANLKSSFNQRRDTLESALADIGRNDYGTANDIFNNERSFYEQQRQFNENLALQRRQLEAQQAASRAAAAAPAPTFGGGTTSATAVRRSDGGYNFNDASGNAISAAAYAGLKGISFRTLLQQMANAGDKGARTALGFVGDDFGYDKSKIGNNANLYNSLVWGTGRQASPSNLSLAQPNFGTLRLAG